MTRFSETNSNNWRMYYFEEMEIEGETVDSLTSKTVTGTELIDEVRSMLDSNHTWLELVLDEPSESIESDDPRQTELAVS